FGFGADNQKKAAPADDGAGQSAPSAGPAAVPQELAETRTYLGTIACPAGQADCPARRMTLTLAPDGQWRARSAPLDGTAATAAYCCWHLVSSEPVRCIPRSGDEAYAPLAFFQSNVLRLPRLSGWAPLLEARLTRQADIDPIQELAAKPAEACPARQARASGCTPRRAPRRGPSRIQVRPAVWPANTGSAPPHCARAGSGLVSPA